MYDIDYYEKMLREYSETAKEIARLRWEWIKETAPLTVLDYGAGVGWFRAHRPKGISVDSYDIGPYPQTGIKFKIYDVVCFWDVLEHINNFEDIEPLLALARYVACTVPVKPENVDFADWKHFKPGEHLHYFTTETLSELFKKYGFQLVKTDLPECPPRRDVHSFLFKRQTWPGK